MRLHKEVRMISVCWNDFPKTYEEKINHLKKGWDLYEDAFPAHEKRPFCAYEALCRNEPGFVPHTLEDSAGVMGFLWYWQLTDGVYLEHFAILKSRRNVGVGGEILDSFLAHHAKVILEVEEPVDELTRRRIGFYQRHKMIFNDYVYTNPGYRHEIHEHQLCLMSSQSMDEEACASFVKDFIFKKPLIYIG